MARVSGYKQRCAALGPYFPQETHKCFLLKDRLLDSSTGLPVSLGWLKLLLERKRGVVQNCL